MSTLTVPTDAQNFVIKGDLDLFNALAAEMGNGTVYIRNGGLYVEGLTDLDETTINTTDGQFTVTGSNLISMNVSAAIQLTANTTSYFTTTGSTLTLSATNSTTGKVTVTAAGTGTNSILLDATNATSGQITIQSAGGSTSTKAVQILASDTTDGDIYIKGSGNYASTNPAVLIEADNATSGQISLLSAGDSASVDAIKILASGTTGGNVLISAAGSTDPAIQIDATSSSGQVLVQSAGDESGVDAIKLLASAATDGNILLSAAGTNTNAAGIKLLASNATSGQVLVQGSGDIAAAVRILASGATSGGIDIDATGGAVTIDTTNTTTGVTIATVTAGVPVTIGTATSLTTIVGDLTVSGTTTTINTETLTVEDNIVVLNSGNGESGLDSGTVIRRFQTPNGAGTGDVVTNPNPVQESGAFQAGSATPGTLVLDEFASLTLNFYKGWWIKVTSGTGNNQVRRIKSYDETTQTATLYVTADNTGSFTDGLDLVTAPAAADTYRLYSAPYVSSYYDESEDAWTISSTANIPDPISGAGTSLITTQQYQKQHTGALDVHPQIYNNVFGSASTTTITFTLIGHGITALDKVYVDNSVDFTPSITTGTYIVQTTPTANTFTITVASSTTSATTSSATITLLHTSVVYANVLRPHDAGFGNISIPGVLSTEDIIITKTSTANFNITTTGLYGCYFLLVGDLNNTDGAMSTFAASSSGAAGSVTRLSSTRGAQNQRIDATWTSTNKVQIYQSPAGSGGGTYTYRVKIISLF